MAKGKKAAAIPGWIAQTKDDAAQGIRDIGDMQREIKRLELGMNDEIALITERYAPQVEAIKTKIAEKEHGVHVWCAANRDTLTNGNKVKTANLITGNVVWRINPPSINVRKVADVLVHLQSQPELARFVRQTAEINKIALLAEPMVAIKIPGISITKGSETFGIEPFEQEAA
jgi:phage host-nuclease inhibitor protein Gam